MVNRNRKESLELELIPFGFYFYKNIFWNSLTKRTCVKRYHTYRSSLEHVAVAGRNDRSIIERHTRREIVRVHVGWNSQRHQRRNTFTLAEHTFFTLSPLRNKLSFRFDTFFFFSAKNKNSFQLLEKKLSNEQFFGDYHVDVIAIQRKIKVLSRSVDSFSREHPFVQSVGKLYLSLRISLFDRLKL